MLAAVHQGTCSWTESQGLEWKPTGQPAQVQLEPQPQEPEEAHPQSPMMIDVEFIVWCLLEGWFFGFLVLVRVR